MTQSAPAACQTDPASASNQASPATLRRGACPSVETPMQTGDGLLVRLRPTQPALSAADLVALANLARAHGNGLIEITARGNLPLRGLTLASVPLLAEGLAAAGIEPQTGVAIEIPPLAGVDPSEIDDATPLATALRAAIADIAPRLAPKLSIVVDGGGALSLSDVVADIRLDALDRNGRWRLSFSGNRTSAVPVADLPDSAVIKAVLAIADALIAVGPAARGRDLDPVALAARLGAVPPPSTNLPEKASPIGHHTIGNETVLGLMPAYGQTRADRLTALAMDLARLGATEFRLAPHRALLVRGLPAAAIPAAQALAETHGFWSDENAPGRTVSVCAGSRGCASATYDTHVAADAFVASASETLDGSFDMHLSGCPKGCAHPAPSGIALCGTAAGVGLVLSGRAGDATAAVVATEDLHQALTRLGRFLSARRKPGETSKDVLDRLPAATIASIYQGLS